MNAGARRCFVALSAALAVVGMLALVSVCGIGSRARAAQTVPGQTRLARADTTRTLAGRAGPSAGAAALRIGGPASGRVIPSGFVGLSIEYRALDAYTGTNASALNPVFVQLVRNLAPGQAPVLRLGGDSTDSTWWPIPGRLRPAGVNYALTAGDVSLLHSLAARLEAQLILGINLEADSTPVAEAEARALVDGVGRSHVEGLELGNEPELYGIFTWDGSGRTGRAPGYDFADYNQDVTRISPALTMAPQAGPAIGAPGWFPYLGQFLSSHSRVAVATLHRYPLQLCYVNPSEPNYPTISHLLSATSSRGLADSVASDVKVAHVHEIPLRIDEMNTNSCGGDHGVSQSFASALWALDTLFEMVRVGVDGVNIHTFPGAIYQLFKFSRTHRTWRATVSPEYYGLLMFTRAAPPGSRLLTVSETGAGQLKAWATRGADGMLRVVAINEGGEARRVAIRPASVRNDAVLERLRAPRLTSRGGVTLAGQSFGPDTSTGRLAGRQQALSIVPQRGQYAFTLPAGSAALLMVSPA